MNIHRATRRLLQTTAGFSMLVASTALAQDRSLVTWSGKVDKEVLLTIRDTTVSTSINGGAPASLVYFDVKNRMPMRAGFVRVDVEGGRGDVDVTQQPTAANGYSAVIRIRDQSAGADIYQLKAFWNPKNGEDRYSKAAATARANAAPLPVNTMHWSGSVDRVMKVEWRGLDVKSQSQNGAEAREVHSSVSNGLPSEASRVELVVREGRGNVSIIQQPTSANGYTAILKIGDPQTGFGHYDFDATWRRGN